jgi:hypothetical protein
VKWTYISTQNQVIDDLHNRPHSSLHSAISLLRAREVDILAIAQETAREELVIDVEGRGMQVVCFHSDVSESISRRGLSCSYLNAISQDP